MILDGMIYCSDLCVNINRIVCYRVKLGENENVARIVPFLLQRSIDKVNIPLRNIGIRTRSSAGSKTKIETVRAMDMLTERAPECHRYIEHWRST
jgi:hypothetical protein